VRRRNLIIHGLLTKFDLDTETGREAAELYLDETFVEAESEAESVRAEVRLWVESAAELGEMLTQPDVLAPLRGAERPSVGGAGGARTHDPGIMSPFIWRPPMCP